MRAWLLNAHVRAELLAQEVTRVPERFQAKQMLVSEKRLKSTGHDVLTPPRCLALRRASLDVRCLGHWSTRPDHGDIGSSRHLHPRQRPASSGDSRSPHAG